VALRKLASLCHRPPQFFLDSKDRQEVALVYLYESLSLWENGEVQVRPPFSHSLSLS